MWYENIVIIDNVFYSILLLKRHVIPHTPTTEYGDFCIFKIFGVK